MNYSLSIHPDADTDAEGIASYIGERSFEGMLRWLDAYEAAQRTKRGRVQKLTIWVMLLAFGIPRTARVAPGEMVY